MCIQLHNRWTTLNCRVDFAHSEHLLVLQAIAAIVGLPGRCCLKHGHAAEATPRLECNHTCTRTIQYLYLYSVVQKTICTICSLDKDTRKVSQYVHQIPVFGKGKVLSFQLYYLMILHVHVAADIAIRRAIAARDLVLRRCVRRYRY